jgi:transcriptional regulator with XRE-family HTH domain
MEEKEVRDTLAGNLKRLRSRLSFTQEELAEKAGISVVFLSDVERANKWPYLDTLVRLANALNVEIYELLRPEEALPPDTSAILTKYTEEAALVVVKALQSSEKSVLKDLKNLSKHLGLDKTVTYRLS